jgi:large subunit ribosomal protein L13
VVSFSLTSFGFFINRVKFFKGQEFKAVKKYTYSARKEDCSTKWWVVDAEGKVLGRLASSVAAVLRGKNNPLYTPHADTGDSVVIVNADKIVLTGNKLKQKKYYRHSGYVGGLKTITAEKLLQKKPEDVIRFAVKGMLPKNSLGRKIYKKLKVYAGDRHPHEAQQPEQLAL